jgi:hypothetical protein
MGDRKMYTKNKRGTNSGADSLLFCGGILRDVFECGDLEDGSAVGIHWPTMRGSATLLFHSPPRSKKCAGDEEGSLRH